MLLALPLHFIARSFRCQVDWKRSIRLSNSAERRRRDLELDWPPARSEWRRLVTSICPQVQPASSRLPVGGERAIDDDDEKLSELIMHETRYQ